MASLESCRRELRSIIRELREIESGLWSDFDGIGETYYSDSIGKIADKYDGVLRKLNNMDTNMLAKFVEEITGGEDEQ